MRPVVVLLNAMVVAVPAYAGPSVSPSVRPIMLASNIDFSKAATFQGPRSDDSDLLFNRSSAPPPEIEKSLLPSLDLGPFHATVGGVGRGRAHLGTYQIDTRDFWNSSVSGSIDSRGARVTFSLPTF
jgi:hypothetical protein